MAYKLLLTLFPSDLAKYILSFRDSNVPNKFIQEEQRMAIHYYIIHVVPKVRKKFHNQNWRKYLMYNPFIQSYLLNTNFYD